MEFQVFRKVPVLRFEMSHSRYRSVGHDCKWLRLPESQSLILQNTAYWLSSFHIVTWDAFCGTVKSSWGASSSGTFSEDLLGSERQPDGLYLCPCLQESVHFLIWSWSSIKVLYEIRTFSTCEGYVHNPVISAWLESRIISHAKFFFKKPREQKKKRKKQNDKKDVPPVSWKQLLKDTSIKKKVKHENFWEKKEWKRKPKKESFSVRETIFKKQKRRQNMNKTCKNE